MKTQQRKPHGELEKIRQIGETKLVHILYKLQWKKYFVYHSEEPEGFISKSNVVIRTKWSMSKMLGSIVSTSF